MKVNVLSTLAIFAALNLVVLSAAQADDTKPTLSAVNGTDTIPNAEVLKNENAKENASVEDYDDYRPKIGDPFPKDKAMPPNMTAIQILMEQTEAYDKELAKNESLRLEAQKKQDEVEASKVTTTVLPSTTVAPVIDSSSTEASSEAPISLNVTAPAGNLTNIEEEDYDEEKSDAENIQDTSDQEQQDELEEEFGRTGSKDATINMFEDPVTNEPVLHSGHLALIFASSLIILSVLAYVGLVLWRGRLEQRYGMRQRLVTEDDYYNNNDVRYFGL